MNEENRVKQNTGGRIRDFVSALPTFAKIFYILGALSERLLFFACFLHKIRDRKAFRRTRARRVHRARTRLPPCISFQAQRERASLLAVLKCFSVDIKGFRPISEAIVTKGGIDVREVSPKNMQSKIVGGLYFAGEILDVDAYTGGFNLQIAFSTGVLAGESAAWNI